MDKKEKEEYHSRYGEFKERGHPFWPDVIFKDVVVSLLVLGVILGLMVLKGVPLGNLADPTSREFVPRPEWYFMFLFQLITYFPGYLEWVGVLVVPGLVTLLLLLLPFLDRRPVRLPSRRPLALGVGTLALAAVVLLTVRAYQTTPPAAPETGPLLTSIEQMGRSIYKVQACDSCHQIRGEGTPVGPALDGVGSRYSVDFIFAWVYNPKQLNPQSVMPAYSAALGTRELDAVAQYLNTLK